MIYPASPSIETLFVDGYKFDICEVEPFNYEFLNQLGKSKPGARFFVVVEDNFIVGFCYAEKMAEAGIENRWDMFCLDKAGCLKIVKQFQDKLSDTKRMKEAITANPAKKITVQPRLDYELRSILERFNINLR